MDIPDQVWDAVEPGHALIAAAVAHSPAGTNRRVCAACGREVVQFGITVYGSATRVPCDRPS